MKWLPRFRLGACCYADHDAHREGLTLEFHWLGRLVALNLYGREVA